jgi:hypothetical protein
MEQRLEKYSRFRRSNVAGQSFIAATGGTILLVVILKFIHLHQMDVFK